MLESYNKRVGNKIIRKENCMAGWYPDLYTESTYVIDFEKFYQEGYRVLLFDVDNTWVPHGAPADQRPKELADRLHQIGYRFIFLSNNKEPRVKSFCEAVGGDGYIYKAGKPAGRSYEKAMADLGATKEETIFVGDQVFTDIWGANRAGVYSILVQPVLKWKEEPQIVLKRFIEALVLIPFHIFCRTRIQK